MKNAKVIDLPASAYLNAEQALHASLQADLTDVVVVGYDEAGHLFVRSSRLSRADAVFLLEKAKEWAMDGGNA